MWYDEDFFSYGISLEVPCGFPQTFATLFTLRLLLYFPTCRTHTFAIPLVRHSTEVRSYFKWTWVVRVFLYDCSLHGKEEFLADIFDFRAITETWLSSAHEDSTLTNLCPDCYAVIHRPRSGSRGGGVAVLYLKLIECCRQSKLDYSSFKYLDFLLSLRPRPIRIIVIYRPQANLLFLSLDEFSKNFGKQIPPISAR